MGGHGPSPGSGSLPAPPAGARWASGSWGSGRGLTRGLLSGLVDRPEEAPLMDLDLWTPVRAGQPGTPQLPASLPRADPPRGREPRPRALRPPWPAHTWPHAGLSCCPHPASPRTGEGPVRARWGGWMPVSGSSPPGGRPRPGWHQGALSKGVVWGLDGRRDEGRQVLPGSCVQPLCRSTLQLLVL